MDGMADVQTRPLLDGLPGLLQDAVAAVDSYKSALHAKVGQVLAPDGKIDRTRFSEHQHLAHGYGWIVTYVETLRETANWASRLEAEGNFGEVDALLAQVLFSKYLAELTTGVPMNQGEIVRTHELGARADAEALYATPAVQTLINDGMTPTVMAATAAHLPDSLGRATVENTGEDETMAMIRDQFRRYSDDKIVPHAHEWHLKNDYIPMDVVDEMAELGVFGLTIPEEFGGLGMGKTAMCVVSEELSRGYIGTGSLGTRSEIAAELILIGGTDAQKEKYLPAIASGEILPTAVFTEPNTGSDLGALRTRAVKDGDTFKITGNKTWITHPVRADLMTLLARTDPETNNFSGLSMFLAEMPRGSDDHPEQQAVHYPSGHGQESSPASEISAVMLMINLSGGHGVLDGPGRSPSAESRTSSHSPTPQSPSDWRKRMSSPNSGKTMAATIKSFSKPSAPRSSRCSLFRTRPDVRIRVRVFYFMTTASEA